jgi:iron complex outermembrane recepter protein
MTMKKAAYYCILSLGTAMALCHSAAAFAQEGNQNVSGTSSSDIIVTARRMEERLQDVPISITVFNQEQVTNRNLTNVQDLAIYTPSLSSNPTFGAENASLSLRGFVQDTGTAPTVGTYFADVPVGRAAALTTQAGEGAGPGVFFDLQNVQILKGPQGTLFGRNTTGGAILFVPQKPKSEFGGYLEGSIGNYDMRRIQGAINLPFGENVRLRVAGDWNKRDGYLQNLSEIGPRAFNDIDYVALRASLVIDITPDLENYTIGSFTHSQTNGSVMKLSQCGTNFSTAPAAIVQRTIGQLACAQLARQANAPFYSSATVLPLAGNDLKQWQVINTTTWRAFDNLTIKNIVSYAEFSNFNNIALFGENFRFGPQALPLYGSVVFNPPGTRIADQSTLTEELQFQGSAANGRLNWQAGGYMELSRPLSVLNTRSANLVNCTDPEATVCADLLGQAFGFPLGRVETTNSRTWFDNYGLYAQATFDITDQFKATGGFRYTWDKQRSEVARVARQFFPTERSVCVDSLSVLPDCFFAASASSSRPTWLLGLDYKPVEDVLLYAKYARGYRAGGVLPTAPRANNRFAPEKLDTYEIGAKVSFDGAVRGNFNIAGFYNQFSNQQLRAGFRNLLTNSQVTGIANAGTSRIYGIEVETSISPFEGFWIDGSYAFLDTMITEIAPIVSGDPNFVVSIAIPQGAPLFYAPKHKLSMTARYTLPTDESVGEVTFAATYTYTDDRLGSYAYDLRTATGAATRNVFAGADYGTLPSFSLLNLNVNWNRIAGSPLDLSVFATNITGEKYAAGVAGVGGAFGFESFAIGEPRIYGFRVRYNFGD